MYSTCYNCHLAFSVALLKLLSESSGSRRVIVLLADGHQSPTIQCPFASVRGRREAHVADVVRFIASRDDDSIEQLVRHVCHAHTPCHAYVCAPWQT